MDCIKHLAKCSKSLNAHVLYRSIEALSIFATILKISRRSINSNPLLLLISLQDRIHSNTHQNDTQRTTLGHTWPLELILGRSSFL